MARLLVSALLLANCGGDEPDETAADDATTTAVAPGDATSATTTESDDLSTNGSDKPDGQTGPSTTAGRAGPGSSGGASAGSGGAISPAGLPTPPKAGSYPYRLKTTNAEGTQERDTSAVVTDVSRNGPEVRQRLKIETEQGVLDNDLSWGPERVLVLRTVIEAGGQKIDCDWNPDMVQAALPMASGSTWQSDSSCSTTAFGQPMTVRNVNSSRIVRSERVQVGAEALHAWVVESTTRTEIKSQAINQVVDGKTTTWFAPAIGMIVKQSGSSTSSGAPGQAPQQRSSELVLLSTTPR